MKMKQIKKNKNEIINDVDLSIWKKPKKKP